MIICTSRRLMATNKNNLERYRSGHNEAVLKKCCQNGRRLLKTLVTPDFFAPRKAVRTYFGTLSKTLSKTHFPYNFIVLHGGVLKWSKRSVLKTERSCKRRGGSNPSTSAIFYAAEHRAPQSRKDFPCGFVF